MSEPTVAELEARLAARERELTVARQREAAAVELLRAVGQAADLNAALDAIVDAGSRLVEVDGLGIQQPVGGRVVSLAGTHLKGAAMPRVHGDGALAEGYDTGIPFTPRTSTGQAILERRTVVVDDLRAARLVDLTDLPAEAIGPVRSTVAVPLFIDVEVFGVLRAMRFEVRPFQPDEIAVLEAFAAQAGLALREARFRAELQDRLAEQTATGRVLRAIAESPTDPQRVLDAVVETAARLCRSDRATVVLADGEDVRTVASSGVSGVRRTLAHPGAPRRPPDPMDPAQLAVPLLLEDATIGYLVLARDPPRPFEERLIALARTLADQAVIAMENARLYAESRERSATPGIGPIRLPPPTTSPSALTPREWEVAGLVAAGRTNRQIAEALVIAEPTAERHVANILGKLGFHARTQLAAWHERQAAAAAGG